MRKKRIYTYSSQEIVEAQLPQRVKDAMDSCGWNAFGVYELVDRILKDEKKAAKKFRPQRGGLAEAMKEVVEVSGMDGLKAHLRSIGYLSEGGVVRVEPYTYDARIGWDTHLVTIDGNAVGFTDGPCE